MKRLLLAFSGLTNHMIRPAPALPDGVYQRDGDLLAACKSCGEDSPIFCDPEEYNPDFHYCGRSPRCCP